jgi:prolyl oligopeptidase
VLNPVKVAFLSGFNPYFRPANSGTMKRLIAIAAFGSILLSCETKSNSIMALDYPKTDKVDTVDTYFDTAVPDPYRWLEDDRST